MSGIVGSAGSKSGIIGTTELEYEEGTWTPVPDAGSISSISKNFYRKIGGICFIQATLTNIQGGFDSLTGLPFATNPTGTSYEIFSGNVGLNHVNPDDATYNMCPSIYDNAIYFYQSRDDTSMLDLRAANYENNDDMMFSMFFFCPVT